MKSTFIALENQKVNEQIINLLISSRKNGISVINATPEKLLSTINKSAFFSDAVFVSGDFLEDIENREAYLDFFGENFSLQDQNGKTIGLYAQIKGTPTAILPNDFELAKKIYCSYFYENKDKNALDYTATSSVFVASFDIKNIEKTLNELIHSTNPEIKIIENENYAEISITAFSSTKEETTKLLHEAAEKIRLLIGDDVFSDKSSNIEHTAVELLIKNNLKIATAESCTGGLVSKLITSVPNSSSVFELGITSYSNRIKQYALNVPKNILNDYGAVSSKTAAYMALGVKNLSGANIGIGITGVAGPSSSEGKSVGTVYIALSDGEHFWVRKLSLSPFSSREEVRNAAAFTAFDLVRRYIECLPKILPEYSPDIENISILYEQPHYKNSSLLFMKNTYEDYLAEKETEEENAALLSDFKIPSVSSPLEKLQKKVLKKKRRSLNFNIENYIENIKSTIKNYVESLFTTSDLKGFMLNSVIKVVALIVVSALVTVTFLSANNFYENYSELKSIAEIQTKWTNDTTISSDGNFYDFVYLNKINPDINAWITIPNTNINYPICSSDNNSFYKTKNIFKKDSTYGALYFDKNVDLINKKSNIVIHGNNLNNGAMFSELINFRDPEFATKARIINLSTKRVKSSYEIFAVLTLSDNSSTENADEFFDYKKNSFISEFEFTSWLQEINFRSLYKADTPISANDEILTLVTDSEDFPSAKVVVFARKLNSQDESGIYELSVNPTPKLPDILYKLNSLQNPYDDTSEYFLGTN